MRRLAAWLLGFLALAALVVAGLFVLTRYLPGGELPQADYVLVEKSARRMTLLRDGEKLKSYRIVLGANPLGHKQQEGDERTPEGRYRLDWRNPRSRFHRAIHISYPNAEDRRSARRRGVSPGGAIMLHGLPNGWGWAAPALALVDWTDGCIAVSNAEMDQIWAAVPDGTPIEIRP